MQATEVKVMTAEEETTRNVGTEDDETQDVKHDNDDTIEEENVVEGAHVDAVRNMTTCR